nr:hypothetical protein [Sphingobium yanoikuyae]
MIVETADGDPDPGGAELRIPKQRGGAAGTEMEIDRKSTVSQPGKHFGRSAGSGIFAVKENSYAERAAGSFLT